MGFEDDFDYNDDFETETADPDSMGSVQKGRKLSRREMREAKKRNAEKTADLPKSRKGLFGRRQRMDDNDDSLTDEHIFDPTRTAMVSGPRDRRQLAPGPVRNADSEFSYLFDPVGDDEGEDDVYPDKSVYSDDSAAKDLLAGLSYDESKDGSSEDFDRYFEEHSKPVESDFTFRKSAPPAEPPRSVGDKSTPPPASPAPFAPVRVTPKKTDPPLQPQFINNPPRKAPAAPSPQLSSDDAFLPELRPDSVFSPQPAPAPSGRNDPPLPPVPDRSESTLDDDFDDYVEYDDYDEDDDYMSHDQDKQNQEYIPYGGMYPSYPLAPVTPMTTMTPVTPMAPMNQMMSYPMVIPSAQPQQSGVPIQTIPIPYPMPMPMPMPMYGQQYPPYPPQ